MKHATIASLIKYSCVSKANKEFFVDDNSRISGHLLWQNVLSAAYWLAKKGLKKGDVVAFYCTSSVYHAITFFACLVSGIVPCCLHIRETKERNTKNVQFIDAKALFVDPDLEYLAQSLIAPDRIFCLRKKFINVEAENLNITNVKPTDLALILISSGTTGEPKCISHTQKSLAATAEYGPYNYDIWSEEDSVIVVMAPSFSAWIHTVFPIVFIQGRVVFRKNFDSTSFLKDLEAERITLAPLVPTIWRMVLNANPETYDLSNLKSIFFSGEPGSESLVKDLKQKIGPNIITSYLTSEGGCAAGVVADSNILFIESQASSTGRAIKDAEVKIINPEGSFSDELPRCEIGEIALKSDSLANGYFKNSLLSKEKFSQGWWRSGDLGFFDHNGLLFVKGRLDNRINTGGIKVFAEDVEKCLLKHPDVQSAAVVGNPDKKWGQKVVAHIVATNDDLEPSSLLNFLRRGDFLPTTHLPKEVHFHDSLPIGPTGKLFRRGLFK